MNICAPIIERPFQLEQKDYAFLQQVRDELGLVTSSKLEAVLYRPEDARYIRWESYELLIIRNIAKDRNMTSPV